jgi:hypothetical protein
MINKLKPISISLLAFAIISCNTAPSGKTQGIEAAEDSTTALDGTRVDDPIESIQDTLALQTTGAENPAEVNQITETKTPAKKVNTPPPPPPPVIEEIAAEQEEIEDIVEEQEEVPSIILFFQEANSFFSKYVKKGKVDYAGIKANPEQLNEIVNYAKSSEPGSGNTYKAFYINAYNIMTIKGIVENYPTSSPLDISGFFKEKKHYVAGEMLTLDAIENVKLRKVFDDARIHFVVVCGAMSCPPIINQAYTAANVNSLMTRQAKSAVNADFFVKVDDAAKEVAVSMIMKWYEEDFVKDGQTTIDYLNKYRTSQIPSDYTVKYQEYNWKVNKI